MKEGEQARVTQAARSTRKNQISMPKTITPGAAVVSTYFSRVSPFGGGRVLRRRRDARHGRGRRCDEHGPGPSFMRFTYVVSRIPFGTDKSGGAPGCYSPADTVRPRRPP
ncbi:hypothetical protein GCM10009550_25210 [Actinocorallia libanotica]|uniref:Uncharacterized protein n=1 Tax=Actinocorallia libanotica TaxID=46162 RepID=A0ABN1QX62_9ACTN